MSQDSTIEVIKSIQANSSLIILRNLHRLELKHYPDFIEIEIEGEETLIFP